MYYVELQQQRIALFWTPITYIHIDLRDVPLIGKLETDHEMGNAKRERKNNKVHAIGASRLITAFPLLGLVEKEKIATSRVYHVNRTFSLKLLGCPICLHWGMWSIIRPSKRLVQH